METNEAPTIDTLKTELHDRTLFEATLYGDYISQLRTESLSNPKATVDVIPHTKFFEMSSPSSGTYKLDKVNYAWYGYQMARVHAAQEDEEVVKLLNEEA